MKRVKDFDSRLALLVEIMSVLRKAENPMSARDINAKLSAKNVNIPKKVINSILFSEGSRYISYDKKNFQYSLQESKASDVEIPSEITGGNISAEQIISGQKSHSTKIFIQNREYDLKDRALASNTLLTLSESGAKASLNININHALYKKYKSQLTTDNESSFFKELIIALANLQLDCSNGKLRDRAEEFTHQLSKELARVINEEQK